MCRGLLRLQSEVDDFRAATNNLWKKIVDIGKEKLLNLFPQLHSWMRQSSEEEDSTDVIVGDTEDDIEASTSISSHLSA